jgi:hypothetical protein
MLLLPFVAGEDEERTAVVAPATATIPNTNNNNNNNAIRPTTPCDSLWATVLAKVGRKCRKSL